jgi:hypothetical protein
MCARGYCYGCARYGPLSNGATTLMFESIPTYPDASRCAALGCISMRSHGGRGGGSTLCVNAVPPRAAAALVHYCAVLLGGTSNPMMIEGTSHVRAPIVRAACTPWGSVLSLREGKLQAPLCARACRYWSMVEKHRITQLYTAPTAIRALIQFGEEVRICPCWGRLSRGIHRVCSLCPWH